MAGALRGRLLAGHSRFSVVLVTAGLVATGAIAYSAAQWTAAPHSKAVSAQTGLGFAAMDRAVPAITLENLAGRGKISLNTLGGEPVVVNLWASTCEVCKTETPALAAMARKLGGKVRFVGIDTVDQRSPATAFVSRYHVGYPIAFDPQGLVASALAVPGLPATFFLSRSGTKIIGENLGALTQKELGAILHRLYGIS